MTCELFNSNKCLNKGCNSNIEKLCSSFKEHKNPTVAKVSKEELIARELAEIIHVKTCHCNHTDGCSWEYEKWGTPLSSTRLEYLDIAKKMLKVVSFKDAKYVMECLR